MKTVTRIHELRSVLMTYRRNLQTVSFVPTMGALHEGHLSLVRIAREHAHQTVVSIFVNPTQFGPREDFGIYPRMPERDSALLDSEKVDILFMPDRGEIYPAGWVTRVQPGPVESVFEGAVRPGHFAGVLTVVAKLFNIVQPDAAVFGQKDAQQLFLIRQMVKDLDFPIEIVEGNTVREASGLAMSSRNSYLSEEQKLKASVLFRAISEGKKLYARGTRSLSEIKGAMAKVLTEIPEVQPEYATAVSEATFSEEDPVPADARFIIAGRLGPVRLIDNVKTTQQMEQGCLGSR